MKKIFCAAVAAVVAVAGANAQKMMHIHHADGSVDVKNVSDVVKVTFEDSEAPIVTDKMVDMGLSVKWASYNVGATTPEGYGNFYAYGETEPKAEYTLKNYKWYYEDYNDWDCDEWEKYFKLGATITGTNYDVAHVKWGEQWRIPTKAEWDELINNCDFLWTGRNGVTGAEITSRITGNKIFLPAAGNMVDAEHTHDKLGCFYWSSTEYVQADISQECRNYRANIDATNHSADGYDYPEVGFSIRAVYGPVPPEQLESMPIPTEADIIDLGLSVKWAAYNVGAGSASGKGKYFAWAETSEKQYTHVYNYKHYDPLTDSYTELPENIGGTEYDPATVNWGEGWRLPTKEEFQELIDKCTWEETASGYFIKGPNGNTMFLPAYGMMTYKGAPRSATEPGYYWSGDFGGFRANGQPMSSVAEALRFTRGVGNKLSAPIVTLASKAGGVQIRAVHE